MRQGTEDQLTTKEKPVRNDDMIIRFADGRCIIAIDREVKYDGPEDKCPPELLAEVEGFNHTPTIKEDPQA